MTTIAIIHTRGRCRWCRCTREHPCANGCTWDDRQQTLCSECVPLDTALRSVAGRRELAEFLQDHDFMRAAPVPAKRRAKKS